MAIMKRKFHSSLRANFDSIVALSVEKGISDKITSASAIAIAIIDLEIKIRQIRQGIVPALLTGKVELVKPATQVCKNG